MANRIALVRLNTHGHVNEGIFQFGRTKIGVVDPFPTDDLKLRDIAIDSEDRVVMLLSSSAPNVDKHFIVRMTPEGNKDFSFSQDAQREISEGRSDINASHHLVIDENDRIIVGLGKSKAGPIGIGTPGPPIPIPVHSDAPFVELRRYNVDGTIDPTFGNNGIAVKSFHARAGSRLRGLEIDDQGRLYVGATLGQLDKDVTVPGQPRDMIFGVARMTADGVADGSYGAHAVGETIINFPGTRDDSVVDLCRDISGRVLVFGRSRDPGQRFGTLAIARLTDEGQMDTSFSGDGLRRIAFPDRLWPEDATVSRIPQRRRGGIVGHVERPAFLVGGTKDGEPHQRILVLNENGTNFHDLDFSRIADGRIANGVKFLHGNRLMIFGRADDKLFARVVKINNNSITSETGFAQGGFAEIDFANVTDMGPFPTATQAAVFSDGAVLLADTVSM